jgi:hypothetical protein
MIHPDTELRRVSDAIGLGVFATRRIPRGTITWTLCALDRVFPAAAVAAMTPEYRTILSRYGYTDSRGQCVLCWDFARFLNHSCEPTCLGLGETVDIAVRDVEPGEQLTCEYGILNHADLECACSAPSCRKIIRGADALRFGHQWDERVRAVLPAVQTLGQPLLRFVTDQQTVDAILSGRVSLPSHSEHYFPSTAGSPL